MNKRPVNSEGRLVCYICGSDKGVIGAFYSGHKHVNSKDCEKYSIDTDKS